jgi:hypothetical protein
MEQSVDVGGALLQFVRSGSGVGLVEDFSIAAGNQECREGLANLSSHELRVVDMATLLVEQIDRRRRV